MHSYLENGALDQFKSLKETGALPERINFAIPSNSVKSRLASENIVFEAPNVPEPHFDPRDSAMNSTVLLLVLDNTTGLTAQKDSGDKHRVIIPKIVVKPDPGQSAPSENRILYPWKTYVTCTIFWVGEEAKGRNQKSNNKSSWDQQWSLNYGGHDDPNSENRIADHAQGEFRPKSFVPKLNSFYIALPYNDMVDAKSRKPEMAKIIPWFSRVQREPGKSLCKGRWIQIYRGGKSCYGQWEDCGPSVTDDWEYVFGNKPPSNRENGTAGIAVSPAIRDYLGMESGDKVHWRFVEAVQVPFGPWKKFGRTDFGVADPDLMAQKRYLDYLKKLRDEQFRPKPVPQLQK